MEHSPAFHRQTRHLLKLLSREGTRLVPSGMGNFVLERQQRRTRETFDASLIATLARKDLLSHDAERNHLISDAGRAYAARAEAHARRLPLDAFRHQHLCAETAKIPGEKELAVLRDHGESVLSLLARARKDAAAFLTPSEHDAGERLRADMTMAALVPRLTTNLAACGAHGGKAQGAPMTDQVVAARQRVNRAMEAVGEEFSGILFDICGLNMGLEAVEQQRLWPRRSAKLVLKLALGCLARHCAGRRSAA